MCGQYYVPDHFTDMLERLLPQLGQIPEAVTTGMKTGCVHPAEQALVLLPEDPVRTSSQSVQMQAALQFWGFPAPSAGSAKERRGHLLINARAETAAQKPTFRESFRSRRCIIPAGHFFEWDAAKNKIAFWQKDAPALFLAGLSRGGRFVIVTTAANDSMRSVHDRMPVLIRPADLTPWLTDTTAASAILQQPQPPLQCRQEEGQLRLF